MEKSGIENRHTVHDLRHTFCTMLRNNNVSVEIAKELMGHSDINITLSVYSHTCDENKIKAVDTIGNTAACM